jgi:putative ABC transport system permease protein
MVALRTLLDQRMRLVLTAGGVALCVTLILFLWSVYRGVREGSVEYVRRSPADVWVLPRHGTNILRASSLLPAAHLETLQRIPGVARAAPALFVMAGAEVGQGAATLYVAGFEPESGLGAPPELACGRLPERAAEIVLDRAFAAKHDLAVGSIVRVGDARLEVVGQSRGTNMFVIQYAFVTLAQAQALAGLPDVASCFMVQREDRAPADDVARRIASALDVEVYDHATFLANNVREMEAGFLPLLYSIACIGAVVLTVILSLILSIHVVECRQDFAVMKALGAPAGFVPRQVAVQALVLTGLGFALALSVFFPLALAIEALAPEVTTRTAPLQVALVGLGVTAIGLVAALLPIQRLRRVEALEVFR